VSRERSTISFDMRGAATEQGSVEAVGTIGVVVVDDSPKARRAIERIVDRSPGFEVLGGASSGEEAVALVGRLRPPLAIIDVRMPGIGGIEAARTISSRWPGTVVVLVSAGESDRLPSAVETSGVAAVLHKPTLSRRQVTAVWNEAAGDVRRARA
jgi:DNA-binding NarL/FixJ family response regulator